MNEASLEKSTLAMSAVEFSPNHEPDSVGQVSSDPGLGLQTPTLLQLSPYRKTLIPHDEKCVKRR